ncbi:MAG TPA: metallophosphoesterase, partial [Myxococcales bacterium]|nr:metallophosphoesterase [Myxococcales bacterium]
MRGRRRHPGLGRALCCLLLCALPLAAEEPRYSWPQPGRVIAFADVHGDFDSLVRLLRAAAVVDGDLRWSAGAAQVVSLGDLLDRGAGSRKAMDLLMRLQGEAGAAGGALHVLLGNHEAMNLQGDLHDTTLAEFAAYAPDEPAGLRERLRGEWIARQGKDSGAQFDQRFPPGWFGHQALFASDGKYGRWLLGLPVAIVIGDTLFMHGGPSAVLSGLPIGEINRRYRAALSGYLSALGDLEAAGLVEPGDAVFDRADLASKRLLAAPPADAGAKAARAEALRRFRVADSDPMLDVDGPNWYRGASLCNEASESDVLKPFLEGLHVKRLVVGHTVARNQRAATRFDGAL